MYIAANNGTLGTLSNWIKTILGNVNPTENLKIRGIITQV